MTFTELISAYAVAARTNLSGPGQREAALSGPVADLIRGVGEGLRVKVSAHNEVSVGVGASGTDMVRPDFGVRVNDVLSGHIELKAPGVSLDPTTYAPRSHNGRQWNRLRELPNLLHTNGRDWRLWRYGELVGEERAIHVKSLATFRGSKVGYQPELERILTDFLSWEPTTITSVSKLVDTLGPLTRLLREEVLDVLKDESKATSELRKPITALEKEWRRVLFPGAKSKQFADGLSQTVVFALLLAVSEGMDVKTTPLSEVAYLLDEQYGVMGRTLSLLSDHVRQTPVQTAIETITRTLSAVDWSAMSSGKSDLYLHLYEHFLKAYDPELKELSGSYYTPVEIVDAMVDWTDEVLRTHLHRPRGLRDPKTQVIDPAMGTGTYPLSVLRKVAKDASQEFGEGVAAETVANMVGRLYGIEIQSAPFSVAELRISQAVKEAGADVPNEGLKLFVGDTLEDPAATSSSEGLSFKASLIAQQRVEANRVKREEVVQAVIGNPPYDDQAGGRGGWIESGIDPATGNAPLAAFRAKGNGRHERHLNNLYAYFWRWATWKAFESTAERQSEGADTGVVCYITATGYLTGPGFKGMREYLRRTCSAGWIINVTPEGYNPPPGQGVFAIKTPVAIGIFVRGANTDSNTPAKILYRDVKGTRDEKFAQLTEISLDGDGWQEASPEWQDPFTPAHAVDWSSYPSLRDLHPWYSTGVTANRTWVYSPSKDVLQFRLNEVVGETDPDTKKVLFKESRDANLTRTKAPLPSLELPDGTLDTYQNTRTPFAEELHITDPKLVQMGYRAFDRQWLIADSRLIHDCRRTLWWGRIPGQAYIVELHSEFPRSGPGVAYSGFVPDAHYFRGSGGGRTYPMLKPDGSANLADGLIDTLAATLGPIDDPTEVAAYTAGVTSHPAYITHFTANLRTPGGRVPITADRVLWDEAVDLGRKVIWCHTYGASGQWDGIPSVTAREDMSLPEYSKSMGSALPQSGPEYDGTSHVLTIGAGQWRNVSPAVRNYTVGGEKVIDAWVSWRTTNPRGLKTSPLDRINATHWEPQWSEQLTEMLCTLTRLVSLEAAQADLMDRVLAGELISRDELTSGGVKWPPVNAPVKPVGYK